MEYPLEEKIGYTDLLVGREKEFRKFDKWISNIPKKLSKSRVILARRKSGKTSFVQRIFNRLWSENGRVIPFYFHITENNLCMSDPFFIANVIQNEYDDRDLTTEEGVVNTVNYEITDRRSEMSRTWREYIYKTLRKVNDRNGKRMLLHLGKHSDRYWTPEELKKELALDLD
ncbi:MAG: hypothetical protein GY866_41590, partial [Proteobacteria bacterium]|nr:hypothetical protein [Pseudomonadota bacterium]